MKPLRRVRAAIGLAIAAVAVAAANEAVERVRDLATRCPGTRASAVLRADRLAGWRRAIYGQTVLLAGALCVLPGGGS